MSQQDAMAEDWQPIRNIGDIRRIEQVPLDQRLSGRNTYEILARSAARFGDKTALVHLPTGDPDGPEVRLTFAELFARVTQAANGFHALNVGPGDTVSILLPNLPETHFAFWGAEAAGVANPINPLLEPEQIIGIMKAAKTKVLVALGPMPRAARSGTRSKRFVTTCPVWKPWSWLAARRGRTRGSRVCRVAEGAARRPAVERS